MMFEGIFGHKKILEQLTIDKEKHQLFHAYLLSGSEHIGKTKILQQFASILQFEKIVSVEQLRNHPAVSIIDEIPIEGINIDTSNTNLQLEKRRSNQIVIDDTKLIRKQLQLRSDFPFHICLISGIERMSREASNSLLKIIEEAPSKKTIFLLSTNRLNETPITIRSRCRVLHLNTPDWNDYFHLLDMTNMNKEKFNTIFPWLHKTPGFILRCLENQDFFNQVYDIVFHLEKSFQDKTIFGCLQFASQNKDRQVVREIIRYLQTFIQYIFEKHKEQHLIAASVAQANDILQRTEKYVERNVSPRICLESCFFDVYPLYHHIYL